MFGSVLQDAVTKLYWCVAEIEMQVEFEKGVVRAREPEVRD